MVTKEVRILRFINNKAHGSRDGGESRHYYRVTIPKEAMRETGFPEVAEFIGLGPQDDGGPAFILKLEGSKNGRTGETI